MVSKLNSFLSVQLDKEELALDAIQAMTGTGVVVNDNQYQN